MLKWDIPDMIPEILVIDPLMFKNKFMLPAMSHSYCMWDHETN